MKVKTLIDFLKICHPEHEVQMVDPESGNIVNLYFEEKKDMVLVDPDEKFVKKIGVYKDKLIPAGPDGDTTI